MSTRICTIGNRLRGLIATGVVGCATLPMVAYAAPPMLYDSKGTSGPCLGVGPIGAPIAKKCIAWMEGAGLVREENLGSTGMTLGTSGKDDGVIMKIDAGSAAAQAGLVVGDSITAVDGKPVKLTPGVIVTEKSFGARGESLPLKLNRGGTEVMITYARGAKDAPPGPQLQVVKEDAK
jgi:PDZ domain